MRSCGAPSPKAATRIPSAFSSRFAARGPGVWPVRPSPNLPVSAAALLAEKFARSARQSCATLSGRWPNTCNRCCSQSTRTRQSLRRTASSASLQFRSVSRRYSVCQLCKSTPVRAWERACVRRRRSHYQRHQTCAPYCGGSSATEGMPRLATLCSPRLKVINLVIDNHAQWFIVVPGAYNLVQVCCAAALATPYCAALSKQTCSCGIVGATAGCSTGALGCSTQ